MTTYRVLAEAAAFHRRRVAAAFISGLPDGPRLQPPRTGRSVLGGLVLAAVCLTGVVVSCRVSGHPDVTWDRHGFHVAP